MPSSSRIVFAEDLVGAAPWEPGPLEDNRRGGADRRRGFERRREEEEPPSAPPDPGYEDGLRDGIAQGVAQARREMEQREREQVAALAQRADALLGTMTAQLALLQQGFADEVVSLAVAIARSAVGSALSLRPDRVIPVVTEALEALADEQGRPVVRLHPDDAALLGEALGPLLAARGAQLVPDEAVPAGGCVAETPRASVDATLATRWRRAVAAIGRDDEWVDS